VACSEYYASVETEQTGLSEFYFVSTFALAGKTSNGNSLTVTLVLYFKHENATEDSSAVDRCFHYEIRRY
jgi:hypothetical protein